MSHHDAISEPDGMLARIRSRRTVPTLFSAAVLALGGAGLAACGGDESAGPEAAGAGTGGADVAEERVEQGASDQPTEVTLSELVENGERYVGQMVTVSGQVTDQDVDRQAATPAAFTIGESIDQDVLVLPAAELTPQGIEDESTIRVQGTVREVNETLADEENFLYEEEGVDDAFLEDFQDQVAIAATQIDTNIPRTDQSQDEGVVEDEPIE